MDVNITTMTAQELREFFEANDYDGMDVKDYIEAVARLHPVYSETEDFGDQFKEREYIYMTNTKGVYVQVTESLELHSGEFALVDSGYEVTDESSTVATLYVFGKPIRKTQG